MGTQVSVFTEAWRGDEILDSGERKRESVGKVGSEANKGRGSSYIEVC